MFIVLYVHSVHYVRSNLFKHTGFSFKIYGPESSGKTTLALHAIAEVQVFYFCINLSSFFWFLEKLIYYLSFVKGT